VAAIYQCGELNNLGVIQACSTRDQGNLALHTGDAPAQVLERRARFLALFGFGLEDLVVGNQTHGTRVGVVTRKMAGSGAWDQKAAIPDTDALITQERGIVLGIFTADCLPIFIYDQSTPAIGIAHAGWRGTINRIAQVTLEKMTAQFHTDPAHCWIGFGPGIGPECFQVEQVVAGQFSDVVPEAVEGIPQEYRVDLAKFNTRLFQAAGVLENHIIPFNRCTRCHGDEFFSYRAEAGNTGRMMSIIALPKGTRVPARGF
jgi:YfiH family protein